MIYLTINATMLQTNRLAWKPIDSIARSRCALYQLPSLATPMIGGFLQGYS